MDKPKTSHLKPGASVLSAPTTPGGAGVYARQGDAVMHASGAGWHIAPVPSVQVPVGGLRAGESSDVWHWSQGASYSGQGVPSSYSPPSFDAGQTGYGSDGRISGGANGTPSF
jgi:hypothetical protein